MIHKLIVVGIVILVLALAVPTQDASALISNDCYNCYQIDLPDPEGGASSPAFVCLDLGGGDGFVHCKAGSTGASAYCWFYERCLLFL